MAIPLRPNHTKHRETSNQQVRFTRKTPKFTDENNTPNKVAEILQEELNRINHVKLVRERIKRAKRA